MSQSTDDIMPGLQEEAGYDPEWTYTKPSCKYCNKGNLNWKQDRKGKWALYTDNGTRHACKEFITGLTKVGKTEKVK